MLMSSSLNAEFPQPTCQANFVSSCLGFGGASGDSTGGTMNEQTGLMQEEEAFIASEMNNLSFQERNKALEDVHCVGEDETENPEMIRRALAALQVEIERLADPTYMRVFAANRQYVEDVNLRLMFLRGKLYDARSAAKQMINYMRNQERFFGTHTLGRDVQVGDLNEEDKQIIRSGIFHIQKERDKAGRAVIYLFNDMFLRKYKIDAMIRAGAFMFFNLVKWNPDVQRRGVTTIFYDVVGQDDGQQKTQSWESVLTLMNQAMSLPMRHSSMHYCMKTNGTSFSLNKVFLQVMLKGFPKYTRVRTRCHYGGSDVELQYMLSGHGISMGTFPVDPLGRLRQDLIDSWYNENVGAYVEESTNTMDYSMQVDDDCDMNMQPEYNSSSQEPLRPTDNDVLLGRGKRIQTHPGNIRFRDWMHEHRAEYDNAYKFKRRRVALELKDRYAQRGVRFLKQTGNDEWTLAKDDETEEKVKQLFRSFRRV